jgi:hypothetical protein
MFTTKIISVIHPSQPICQEFGTNISDLSEFSRNSAIVTGEWGGSPSGKNGIWLNAYHKLSQIQ